MDKWLYPEDLGDCEGEEENYVINLFTHEGDNEVYMDVYDLPIGWRDIVTKNNGKDGKPSIHDIMIAR